MYYNNTNSGATSVNVQDAFDELYQKLASCKKIKDNTVYFAYEDPTTAPTPDYTTLNKNVFAAKNGD